MQVENKNKMIKITCTRLHLAYAVSHLSQSNSCYSMEHWRAAKRVLRYLTGTIDYGIMFSKNKNSLTGYVYADWGACPIDRCSYTVHAFTLNGSAVSWESRKQKTVALSCTEAKYMASTEAIKEVIYFRRFFKEL